MVFPVPNYAKEHDEVMTHTKKKGTTCMHERRQTRAHMLHHTQQTDTGTPRGTGLCSSGPALRQGRWRLACGPSGLGGPSSSPQTVAGNAPGMPASGMRVHLLVFLVTQQGRGGQAGGMAGLKGLAPLRHRLSHHPTSDRPGLGSSRPPR